MPTARMPPYPPFLSAFRPSRQRRGRHRRRPFDLRGERRRAQLVRGRVDPVTGAGDGPVTIAARLASRSLGGLVRRVRHVQDDGLHRVAPARLRLGLVSREPVRPEQGALGGSPVLPPVPVRRQSRRCPVSAAPGLPLADPASERTAEAAALRSVSDGVLPSSGTGPRPTAAITGAETVPASRSLVTSPTAPVAPSRASVSRETALETPRPRFRLRVPGEDSPPLAECRPTTIASTARLGRSRCQTGIAVSRWAPGLEVLRMLTVRSPRMRPEQRGKSLVCAAVCQVRPREDSSQPMTSSQLPPLATARPVMSRSARSSPAFGGWEMPLEYAGGGVLKEHAAVREAVGVFDVSHLGKATVGDPARSTSSTPV